MDLANEHARHLETIHILQWPEHVVIGALQTISVKPGNIQVELSCAITWLIFESTF